MYRFRKRSDAKSADLPPEPQVLVQRSREGPLDFQPLHTLPPASDFRTSLILPDLSRRFTILRESTAGDAIDLVRSKFAERRAHGFQDTITEEEEDMIINALKGLRSGGGNATQDKNSLSPPRDDDTVSSALSSSSDFGSLRSNIRNSAQSSAFSMSSGTGSHLDPKHVSMTSSRSSRRQSSNLFASGHFRDMKVMRKTSAKAASIQSTSSSTPTSITNGSVTSASVDTERPRPSTPDKDTSFNGVPSSPSSFGEGSIQTYAPSPKSAVSILPGIQPLQFTKRLTDSQMKRMSTTLEDVIREMEEEAEDQVLVPRSSTSSHPNGSAEPPPPSALAQTTQKANSPTADDVRTKLIEDTLGINSNSNIASPVAAMNHQHDDHSTPRAITDMSGDSGGQSSSWAAVSEERNMATRSPSPYGSASPVPHVPGYIPGMPRPMTPRQLDLDDQRSHSTTPRATAQHTSWNASSTFLFRRGSNASTTNPDARPTSPSTPLLLRTPSGRVTPDDRQRNVFDYRQTSPTSTHVWKRPSSPLSASSAFQSMTNGSNPLTSSQNSTWAPQKTTTQSTRPLGRNGTVLAHGRNLSSVSFSDAPDSGDTTATEGPKSTIRALRSPVRVEASATSLMKTSRHLDSNNASSSSSTSPTATSPLSDVKVSTIDRLSSPSPMHDTKLTRSTPSPSNQDTMVRSYQKSPVSLVTPPISPFSVRYQSPINFTSMQNSSRTSLVSAGSSYHSWDESVAHESGFIGNLDDRREAWHDFPESRDTSLSSDQKFMVPDEPEAILRQFTGLSRLELTTIQHKLVDATQIREKSAETRSPSTLRRRRPSTAQSMHSFGGPSRTTSPAPQTQTGVGHSTAESAAKATALLASVMDSIQQLSTTGIEPRKEEPVVIPITVGQPESDDENPEDVVIPVIPIKSVEDRDSPSRRNKDLTDMLFGEGDGSLSLSPSPPGPVSDSASEVDANAEVSEEDPDASPVEVVIPTLIPTEDPQPQELPQEIPQEMPQEMPPQPSPVPSHSSPDDAELLRQIQEKVDAATAQLRKSPQQSRFNSPTLPPSRKKISPHDISSPRLLQSSTSIEKFPSVPSTSSSQPQLQRQPPSKLSFSQRLRNTLKGKNTPGEEILTPWTADNSSFSNLHGLGNTAMSHSSPRASPIAPLVSNVADSHMLKAAGHSPPGSASGRKGFMSFFRKKGQQDHHYDTAPRNASPSTHAYMASNSSFVHVDKEHLSMPQSAPPLQNRTFVDRPEAESQTRVLEQTVVPESASNTSQNRPFISHSASRSDPLALARFIEAGSSLGLRQEELNEILSKAHLQPLPPAESTPSITIHASPEESVPMSRSDRQNDSTSSSDQTLSPSPEVGVAEKSGILSRPSLSPEPTAPLRLRQPVEGRMNVNSAVVRRTIIFPSANGSSTDLTSLVRKASKGRKRASGTSLLSNRSVHDRVPTPPPSRAKRQSVDSSPPVPSLPNARTWYNQGGLLQPRATFDAQNEKTTSMYESLYDMYAGQPGVDVPELPRSPTQTSLREGEALEVIELANGETIWSIVNNLRTDDAESIYPHRSSFQSEFSAGAHESDGEQLFFKEHARTGSKGSNRSGLFRRKTTSAAVARPETKVFHSSSAQIARLIDELSRGADAGSFNIIKRGRPGHSHSGSLQSDSDIHWTVEERVEKHVNSSGTAK